MTKIINDFELLELISYILSHHFAASISFFAAKHRFSSEIAARISYFAANRCFSPEIAARIAKYVDIRKAPRLYVSGLKVASATRCELNAGGLELHELIKYSIAQPAN